MDPVLYLDDDADRRLESLGLSRAILHEALLRSLYSYLGFTENHPNTTAGFNAWSELTWSLRDQLTGPVHGWTVSRDGSLERTVNPDGTVAVLARGGTPGTGRRDRMPQARGENGARTVEYVHANERQLQLFPLDDFKVSRPKFAPVTKPVASSEQPAMQTWVLLYYRDFKTNVLRAELSLPVSMDDQGLVEHWIERIILDTIDFGSPEFDIEPAGGPQAPSVPEIEVPIKRRG